MAHSQRLGRGTDSNTLTDGVYSQEIVTALNGGKNIVPVTDHFLWPEPSSLPEDMRSVLNFNGVK